MEIAQARPATRNRVLQVVAQAGPVTAAELATELGVTPAAVRRHLDSLVVSGLIETRPAPGVVRGRGRPARAHVLTDAGHQALVASAGSPVTDETDIATAALQFLADHGGEDAVRRFAEARAAGAEDRYSPVVEAAGPDPRDRAAALAGALTGDGFAASVRPLAGNQCSTDQRLTDQRLTDQRPTEQQARPTSFQLCQGHCPVQHVAARFPQLCEAETRAFARLLRVDVRRLSTLAGGGHACTTHLTAPQPSSSQTITTASGYSSDERTHP